jgi:hypothetical protein
LLEQLTPSVILAQIAVPGYQDYVVRQLKIWRTHASKKLKRSSVKYRQSHSTPGSQKFIVLGERGLYRVQLLDLPRGRGGKETSCSRTNHIPWSAIMAK